MNVKMAMAARASAVKLKLSPNTGQRSSWEVSERRQVGDAESMVNMPDGGSGGRDGKEESKPWWRDVGMEEGM